MNSRERRKLAAAEHQKQRDLQDVLRATQQQFYEKHGRLLVTYGLSTEQAIVEYEEVLSGRKPMPKRDVRAAIGLASIMALSGAM